MKITTLFRQATDTLILTVLLENKFYDPYKTFIGRIKSNLVYREVCFNIKLHYFVSINDP